MNKDLNILITKINAFKRKYLLYQIANELVIIALILVVFSFMAILTEYLFFLPSAVRKILFFSSVLFIIIYTTITVFVPVFKILGIPVHENKDKITNLISSYFPEIKDKLKNTLELGDTNFTYYSKEIIDASITQKCNELKIFDFQKVIKYSTLLKILKYFFGSLILVLAVFMADRSLIVEPARRIIHYNVTYKKNAPFYFTLLNKELKVKKGDNFKVLVSCTGKSIPSLLYINIEGNDFMMKNNPDNVFEYEINSVTNKLRFYFTDLQNNSQEYILNTIAVPMILDFSVEVIPPEYTKKKEEKLENTGDLKIPAGTEVKWVFNCFDTDSLQIITDGGKNMAAGITDRKKFVVDGKFFKSGFYEIKVKNNDSGFENSMKYKMEIVNDLFPEIVVKQIRDSSYLTRFYFNGRIKDDYGFTSLDFNVKSEGMDTTINLSVNKGMNDQEFYYSIDLKDFKIYGDNLAYYFSVKDNDMVNQPKTTLSETFSFNFPSEDELKSKDAEDLKNIEKLIRESSLLTKNIKEEINQLQLKSIDNSISDWEKKQMVNSVISQRNQLEQILDKIENAEKQRNEFQNTFNEQNSEIVQKQKEIEELLNDVMTDELKKLLEEFNKLADEFNNKKLNDLNNKLNFSLDDLSKQLERNIELLKKFKLEQRIENIIKDLEEIKVSQKDGAEEVLKPEGLKDSQKRIEEDILKMKNVTEELNEVQKENSELKRPLIFDSFENETGDIENSMEKTKEAIEKGSKKASSASMNDTSEKLENLIFGIKQMLKSNEEKNDGEDLFVLKMILKNILYISTNQEDINSELVNVQNNGPVYSDILKKQKILWEQSNSTSDSIYELARRVPQVGNFVNQEIVSMNINFDESLKKLGEGNLSTALVNQRLIMTSANNLALFFADMIKNMEEEMNSDNGQENCDKPGGKGKIGGMKKSAENLKDQLQNLIDKMKKGNNGSLSKEMSDALMQHELMQQMLRELLNGNEIGQDTRNQLKQIDNLLEQNRKDIMRKNIQQNLVNRNNEILTRLLDAEKSEKEKDFDNKRESNTADQKFYSNPAKFFKTPDNQNITLENLQRNILKVTDYYLGKQKQFQEKYSGK